MTQTSIASTGTPTLSMLHHLQHCTRTLLIRVDPSPNSTTTRTNRHKCHSIFFQKSSLFMITMCSLAEVSILHIIQAISASELLSPPTTTSRIAPPTLHPKSGRWPQKLSRIFKISTPLVGSSSDLAKARYRVALMDRGNCYRKRRPARRHARH